MIGSSLFGNLFSSAKKVATTAAKTALKNAGQQASNTLKTRNMKALLTSKVKDAAKNMAKEQLGVPNLADAKNLDTAQLQAANKERFGSLTLLTLKKIATAQFQAAAMEKANHLGSDLAQKALSKVNRSKLLPAVKDSIKQIAASPKVKKALNKNSKELLGNFVNQPAAPLTDAFREIMSNILSGSGVKRIV